MRPRRNSIVIKINNNMTELELDMALDCAG